MVGIRRREFITLLGGTAAAWPLAARAQGGQRRRVAVMMNLPQSDPEAERAARALVTKLQELGWTEGRNIDFDFRKVGDQVDAFPGIIKQIAQLKPDITVARGGSVALALQRDAATIPVVFVQVTDPIGEGLVQNSGKARWQHHRVHEFRTINGHKVAGDRKGGRSDNQSGGGPALSPASPRTHF